MLNYTNTQKIIEIDDINFGKYKGKKLNDLLKDRKYCNWLKLQIWFNKDYPYLFTKVSEYNPRKLFMPDNEIYTFDTLDNFISSFPHFYMKNIETLDFLNDDEKICYSFYLEFLEDIKQKLLNNKDENPFNIKAPVKTLINFENKYALPRETLKNFIETYDLDNFTTIIEKIKNCGGIVYNAGRSFYIAKENSKLQENFWENLLKQKYSSSISTQYKYNNCFFDIINFEKNIVYECKLSMKDFNQEQYIKYIMTLNNMDIVYLIGKEIIIDIKNKTIFCHVCKLDELNDRINNINENSSFLDALCKIFFIHQFDDTDDISTFV